jgi:hypothetical protein
LREFSYRYCPAQSARTVRAGTGIADVLALADTEETVLHHRARRRADAVWRSREMKLPALARHVHAPQQTFLAELGKASRLYPELDGALRAARPLSLSLDTEGAHRFLSGVTPALATAGFGVQLPGWWSKPSTRLGLKVTASTPSQPGRVAAGAAVIGFEEIASFRSDLALGDEALTVDELAELAELKAPLVRSRGHLAATFYLLASTTTRF